MGSEIFGDNMSIFIFGDQTDDARQYLRALLHDETDPLLTAFMKASYEAIQAELLAPLRVDDRSNFRFASLLDMLEAAPKCSRGVGLDHALTTICHFGLFFEKCRQSRGVYPSLESTRFIGFCVGSLAAATIGHCKSLSELLPVAVQVCVLAYKVGELAYKVGFRFDCSSGSGPSSWAIAVLETDVQEVNRRISKFIKTKGIPKASKPFVTTVSLRSVTICGPPHVLQELRAYEGFQGSLILPLQAPYHAPHLYDEADIRSLLSESGAFQGDNFATGENRSLKDALEGALRSILLNRLDYHEIVSNLKTAVGRPSIGNAVLVPMASSSCQSIYQALRTTEYAHITVADPVVQPFTSGHSGTGKRNTSRSQIAIVGMSGRFPGADDVSKFWDILHQGLDVHEIVPPLRWDAKSHVDVSEKPSKNTSATPYGCWLEEPGLFDARFFGMSPREAEQVDPAQRLALLTAYEALEDGGIVPGTRSTQRDRVGVCYGVTSNDWMETNSAQNIDTYMIPGGNRAFIPGRINYFFGFSGPSLAIDTACSSSLAAIHTACNILWRGEADTMICGGTNILTNPDFTAGLDRGHFLSRTGNCKTFDDEADGYCRGEGVGTVILKRLEDAIRDRDPIKGCIVNACTNHSAEAESITRPCPQAQKDIFKKVLDGLSPAQISYIEMHGTGTQVGDATEMASVIDTLAPLTGPQSRSGRPVYIGSVKSNVGHGEAAAGVTSLIKLLLMMQRNVIPPHIGIKTRINRKFPTNLEVRGVRIAKTPIEWNRAKSEPRHALLNNFSAAGGNTTLLLEDAPLKAESLELDPRSTHVVVVSAKTPLALQANAKEMLSFIEERPGLDLASLSYTTTARRLHHPHRVAVAGSTTQGIAVGIAEALEKGSGKTRAPTATVVFAFTGQGSDYIGMGKDLYHNLASFREDIDMFNRIATNEGFESFLSLIKDSGSDSTAFSPEAVQLAIISLQMALIRLWKSWGITPAAVVGHSLGHYAALYCAGVISVVDTIFLVGTRARQLRDTCQPGTHSMMVVRAPIAIIVPYLDDTNVEIACINGPNEFVLTGLGADIETARLRLSRKQLPSRKLDLPFAFHSSQVDCVLEDFQSAISNVKFRPPLIPVLCPLTKQVVRTDGKFSAAHLKDHYRKRVNFVGAIEAARRENIITKNTVFLEIGHSGSVTTMLRGILGSECKAFPSLLKNRDAWSTIADALARLYREGLNIKWDEYHREFAKSVRVISLPHYKWDLKHYWIPYVNDWSLRKGEPAQIASYGSSMLSTTIHSVCKEVVDERSGMIVLLSDISSPNLHNIVQGHKVDGYPLCTPSIYADIALTVGRYVKERWASKIKGEHISIDDMTIEKALIAQPTGPQWLQTEVVISEGKELKVSCRFSSVNDAGDVIVDHASCMIAYSERPTPRMIQREIATTRPYKDWLRRGMSPDRSYRFTNNMVYRMVATLADFDRAYRGIQEVVLDNEDMVAASRIDFRYVPQLRAGEKYTAHPACVDALAQTAGFVMNANETSDLETECFVNHGWDSFQLFEDLQVDETYHSFVKMEKGTGSVWQGTLRVMRGDVLVAVFRGIKLQGVPRRLLRHVLSAANKLQSGQKQEDKREDLSQNLDNESRQEVAQSGNPEHQLDIRSTLEKIVSIVAEESGIDKADLSDDTDFISVGLDSLLALLITTRLKDDLGFDIGPTLSIFDKFKTIGQLKSGYAESRGLSPGTSLASSTSKAHSAQETPECSTPENHSVSDGLNLDADPPSFDGAQPETARAVSSVVLQRASPASPTNTKSENATLFLFPDGSGSALSYAALAPVSPSITVIGLICPYRRDPQAMACSLDALLRSYVREMRRRQPTGPYSLGGWSSGGVFAYRAAQLLLDAGDGVRDIILLDSPAPTHGLDRLPARFYEHCQNVGVFDQIGGASASASVPAQLKSDPPEWLVPHFNATIDLLSQYHATPLRVPHGMRWPRVALCWAGRCALDGQRYARYEWQAGDGDGVRFLTERRTDFGPGEWKLLLSANSASNSGLFIEILAEHDHFDMMYGEGGKALAAFMRRALRDERDQRGDGNGDGDGREGCCS